MVQKWGIWLTSYGWNYQTFISHSLFLYWIQNTTRSQLQYFLSSTNSIVKLVHTIISAPNDSNDQNHIVIFGKDIHYSGAQTFSLKHRDIRFILLTKEKQSIETMYQRLWCLKYYAFNTLKCFILWPKGASNLCLSSFNVFESFENVKR